MLKAKCLKYIAPNKYKEKYVSNIKFEKEIFLKYHFCKSVFNVKKKIIKIKGSTYSWYKNLGNPYIISKGNKITRLFFAFSLKSLNKTLNPIELKNKSKRK